MFIRYYAEPSALASQFSILYTAYRDKPSGKACEDDEYDCEDAKCINANLRCNGNVNCQFRWDEESCPNLEQPGQSEHIIIIVVVFGLILGGMMVTFLINCLRKIARDQKTIREHIRQSRESEIDAIGRRDLKKSMESINKIRDHHSVKTVQLSEANMYQRQESGRSRDDEEFLQNNDTAAGERSYGGQQDHDFEVAPRSRQVYPAGVGESKMCETAVQTRESLFQNVHIIQSPSEIHTPEARLSSFGKPHPHSPSPLTMKPMHTTDALRHHHHPHHYDTRPHHIDRDRYGSSYSQQENERKSAPDVIIMTSVQR